MATIVFGDRHSLAVREDAAEVVERIAGAETGDQITIQFEGPERHVRGFFLVTLDTGDVIPVRPGPVAYVLP